MRIFLGGVAAMLAIALIAGCGSGGDSTEAALTKAQFIKRGNAICRTALKQRTRAVNAWIQRKKEGGKTEEASVQELGHLYVTVALPPIKEASEELAELGLPARDLKAEKFVELFTAAIATIEEKPTLMFEHKPYRSADLLAKAYGLEDCFF